MDASDEVETGDPKRALDQRLLFGLLGIGLVAVALWLTGLAAFMTAPDCGGPNTRDDMIAKALAGGVAVLCVTPAWLGALSLLRVACGRRALRSRSWIGAPLAMAALALPLLAVVFENEPPPSATCQPFEMS